MKRLTTRLPLQVVIQKEFQGDIQEYSYNFRTPYKANASAAFVISNKGLVSVDYEFTAMCNAFQRQVHILGR